MTPTPTIERKNQMADAAAKDAGQQRQRRQMLVALGLLLVALIVVVWKDQDFWFSNPPPTDDTAEESPSPPASIPSKPETNVPVPVPQSAKPRVRSSTHSERRAGSAEPVAQQEVKPGIVATNRTALPPLEIEVMAGGPHAPIQPTNHSVKIDMQPATAEASAEPPAASPEPATVATNAGERVRISPDTAQAVERPVEPNYPLLAKQMKVQGAVVLQALIGQEGSIQDLRVISGPAILSTAAMDAVRQWRFHPYLQSGQAVETEARITVNFTISTY